MSLQALAARGIKWQVFEIVGRQSFNFLVFTFLARRLAPSDFGLMGFVTLYLSFVTFLVDQGIATALIQRKELTKDHLNSAFWYNVACALLVMSTTYLAAPKIAEYMKEPRLAELLWACSLTFLISASTVVHNAILAKSMDFKSISIRNVVSGIVGGLCGIGMVIYDYGVWALVGQQLASSIVAAIVTWGATDWRPSFTFCRNSLRDILSTSSGVLFSSLLWQFSSRLDQLTIGFAFGSSVLGEYVVGRQIVDFAYRLVTTPVGAISLPTLSRLQDDPPRLAASLKQAVRLNSAIVFPVFTGIALVAPTLIPLLYGSQWTLASVFCILLSLYTLIISATIFIHPALLATGGVKSYVFVNALHTVGVVLACGVGMHYHPWMLLAGIMINMLVITIIGLSYLRLRINLTPQEFCAPMLAPGVACVVMAVLVSACGLLLSDAVNPQVSLGLQIALGCLTYIGCMALLAPACLPDLFQLIVSRKSERSPNLKLSSA